MFHIPVRRLKRGKHPATVDEVDSYTVRQLAGLAQLYDIAHVQLVRSGLADTVDLVIPPQLFAYHEEQEQGKRH